MSKTWIPMTRSVVVDGVEQRFHVAGSGPFCVAHSGGPGVSWDYLRMPELEHHLTMVYLEPIGTGASGRLPTHPNGYTLDAYAAFIDAVIEALGDDSVHLIGHSFAGLIAQRYALQHPERLSSLVLYASEVTDGEDHQREALDNVAAFRARLAHRPEADDVATAWSAHRTSMDDAGLSQLFRAVFPVYFADYWADEDRYRPIREAVRLSRVVDDASPNDHRGRLSSIKVPTLIVTGRYDVVCPPRWSEEIHAEIENSTLVLMPDCGHFPHLEQPQEFAEIVVPFVRRWTIGSRDR